MANDARDPLSRRSESIHVGHEFRLAKVHSNGTVATDAEIAIRTVGQHQDRTVKCIKNRTHLRVCML